MRLPKIIDLMTALPLLLVTLIGLVVAPITVATAVLTVESSRRQVTERTERTLDVIVAEVGKALDPVEKQLDAAQRPVRDGLMDRRDPAELDAFARDRWPARLRSMRSGCFNPTES